MNDIIVEKYNLASGLVMVDFGLLSRKNLFGSLFLFLVLCVHSI